MSTISKVFIVVNVVLSVFLLGTVAAILAKSEDFRGKYLAEQKAKTDIEADLNGQLDSVRGDLGNRDTENRRLVNSVSELEAQNQSLKAERDQVRADNNQFRNDLSGLNTSLSALQTQLSDVEGRNKALMDNNEQYRQDKATAESAKESAEEDRARLEGDLERRDSDVAELERKLVEVSGQRDNLLAEREALAAAGVEVEKIVGNVVPKIEGQVAQVGSDFVVLNVGQDDGVLQGFPFDVYRGRDYIGRVVVTDVYPDTAVARIAMPNNRGLSFEISDIATTRL
jgi:septal ring factor EnvC (AmiA/AmiB activator)